MNKWVPKRHRENVTEEERETEEGQDGMNCWLGTVSGSILTVWAVVFGEAREEKCCIIKTELNSILYSWMPSKNPAKTSECFCPLRLHLVDTSPREHHERATHGNPSTFRSLSVKWLRCPPSAVHTKCPFDGP